MRKKTIKLKIPIPEDATVYAETKDKGRDLLIYEVDQLEVLEEVKFDTSKLHFHVKDGQYVSKGDVIFSEGLLGHKVMVSDFNGIIEIQKDRCRILGQKKHFERRINIEGEVVRIVPNRFIEFQCSLLPLKLTYYNNYKVKLSDLVYLEDKKDINETNLKLLNFDTTIFVNDNLYIEDVAKLIAFGAKRIIVNAMFINDLGALKKEIDKIDSFAIISGFGEFVSTGMQIQNTAMDILWGKHTLYLSSSVEPLPIKMYEHPYWGVTGDFSPKNDLVGQLDYNGEVFEFYLKNLEKDE